MKALRWLILVIKYDYPAAYIYRTNNCGLYGCETLLVKVKFDVKAELILIDV
jgi:hypothetical protein